MSNQGRIYVGVDMGLENNVAVVLGERAEQLGRFRFPNERDGYDYFQRQVERLRESQQAPAALIGMEPTNYFWKLLATDLEQRGSAYRLVNPYTMKKHREGNQLHRSKDDPRDAFTIAELLRTGKYTETRLLRGGYAELRQHAVLYDCLRSDIRRQKVLIRNVAGQLFPELTSVYKDFAGATASAMLCNHAAAVVVRQMSLEAFIAVVRADFQAQRLQVAPLRSAHRQAARSVGVVDGIQGLQLALRLHIETWERLENQLEEAHTAFIDTFLTLPESRYLLSLQQPSSWPRSATRITTAMGSS